MYWRHSESVVITTVVQKCATNRTQTLDRCLFEDMQQLYRTLVILSAVTVLDLMKTSQTRVVAGLNLRVAAAVRLSRDGHRTGDRRDHRC